MTTHDNFYRANALDNAATNLERCLETHKTIAALGGEALSTTDYDNIARAAKHLRNKAEKVRARAWDHAHAENAANLARLQGAA